jgi:hypothetical protein
MNAAAIVRDIAYKRKRLINDSTVEHIIWEETGFPAFWAIPTDGATPEECFKKQVNTFFDNWDKGEKINEQRQKEKG